MMTVTTAASRTDPPKPAARAAEVPTDGKLRDLWLRHLGPKARDPKTNILHTGIGLKRIARLLKAIEEECGIKVPATALLRLGTLDALTAAIPSRSWPAPSACLLMKDGDGRAPLYVVSAGSGLVLELCDLVRLIDYPGQIWGLQLPGLDGEAEPLTDMTAIAAFYGAAVTARQPSGPYHFVGYSFGGLAGLETARRLQAEGGKIGLIGLIDANLDEKYWPKTAWFAGMSRRSLKRLADALVRSFGRKARGQSAASVRGSIHYIGGFEPDFQTVRDAAIVAYQTYRPHRSNLKVTLFRSELGDPHACDPAPVWRQFIRDLEIVHSPGSHTTMVRPPHAQVLAGQILARL